MKLSRILLPPSLLIRQFSSALLYSYLSGWKCFTPWLLKHAFSSIPISAGAKGMGCIGYPDHPVWEVTSRCNLSCKHCHVSAGEQLNEELTTSEGKKLIDDLRKINSFRMLVYTGGEPLVRQDLFELLRYSKQKGFVNILATNATLINKKSLALELKARGVKAVAVSIDSTDCKVHNTIRNNDNAFSQALEGIAYLAEAKIPLQINVTAMEYNFDNLKSIINFAQEKNAVIVLMYQLVAVGKAQEIKDATLSINRNEQLVKLIASVQKKSSVIIEPVAGPQYWPFLLKNKNNFLTRKLSEKLFHGCCAGRGFVYIKANGDVWPCPFININAGNIKKIDFSEIWSQSDVFLKLRNRENLLKGKCANCEFTKICGGCRARALICNGDLMSEDPSCFIK